MLAETPSRLNARRAEYYGGMRHGEAALLTVLAILTTAIFAVTSADIAAARIFYHPEMSDHWPLAARLPWSALYRLAPAVTASLVLAAAAGLICGVRRKNPLWRRYAVFVLLTLAIGPGLLVNAVFKDHWERPRPRDVVQFEGLMHYVPAPLRGPGGGSFPCGHCSVGFLYGLGFWIWRYRRPRLAGLSLATGLLAGGLLGIGRMAAGAHFLSDVIWSALLAFGVAHVLYYYALRIPQHETLETVAVPTARAERSLRWSTVAAVLSALAVLGALFAGPRGTAFSQTFCPTAATQPVRTFEVTARKANIEIVVVDATTGACISASGELHGFGLPGSQLSSGFQFDSAAAQLHYRIEQLGWFTDLSGEALIRLPAEELQRIAVSVDRGTIKVTDLRRAGGAHPGLQLDLRTGAGLCSPVAACRRDRPAS